MDEKVVKKILSQELKSKGVFFYNTRDQYKAGLPDVYICGKGGRSIWVELKCKRKPDTLSHPLTKLQSSFLKDINEAGGLGLMVVWVDKDKWCVKNINQIEEVNRLDWEKTIDTETLLGLF